MDVDRLDIPEVMIFRPRQFRDGRGFLSETFNAQAYRAAGVAYDFVQDNHSVSVAKGTVRGMHFQTPPHAQAKLVRVVRGAILDVALDVRHGSPTFGQHVAAEISADAWNQILIPEGFAHGFCTLAPDTEVVYKVSAYYAPEHDKGVLWNDPALGIDWPVTGDQAVVSDKDRALPRLADAPAYFTYRAVA